MLKKVHLTLRSSVLLVITVALLLSGCQHDNLAPNGVFQREQRITIEATYEQPEMDTKTVRDDNAKIYWIPGDAISLFFGSGTDGGSKFVAQNDAVALKTAFSGSITAVTGGSDIDDEDTYFWGLYPYDATSSCDGSSVTMSIPAVQPGMEGTFAPGMAPSLGRSQKLVLSFRNIWSGFGFTVSEAGFQSVTFKGNGGEYIAGKARIGIDENNLPKVLEILDGVQEVTLTAPSAAGFVPGQYYYMQFFPCTFESGFSVELVSATKKGTYVYTESMEYPRSTWKRAANVDNRVSEWVEYLVPPDDEIWYITSDNQLINLEASYPRYASKPFDSNVISHQYLNGMGVIKCDGPIKIIYDHVFGNSRFRNVTSIFLPNSIEELKTGAITGTSVEELRIPDNLQCVGSYALRSHYFKRFIGKHTSYDGRAVILEEGYMPNYGNKKTPVTNYMAAFAPSGVSDYSIPSEVEVLGWCVFSQCPELRHIRFNEGLITIMGDCFVNTELDCAIVFPSTLENIDASAFRACAGITGFYGNAKFHTLDHMCLKVENNDDNNPDWTGTWITKFVGLNLNHYSIPDGIKGVSNYAFENMPILQSISFPPSIVEISAHAFENCPNLNALYGECVSEDHKGIVFGTKYRKLLLSKGITKYIIPNGIKNIGYEAFAYSEDLEEVIIPDSVIELGGYDFANCPHLKKVVLSTNLESVSKGMGNNPFLRSHNLEEIYFRSIIPPLYNDLQFESSDCSNLTVYVPNESLELYKKSGWYQYAPYMVGYEYDDISTDYYISSDFSQDGKTTTLQRANNGAGINLLLMGDAFSDRQIADGTYDRAMRNAMDAFFSEEPYKSFKDRFNVTYVNVVSMTEGYEHTGQALETGFGVGTHVGGNDMKVINYAKNVVSDEHMEDALIIVMMNKDAYAGTCYLYYPDKSGDYGHGLSIAYFPTSSNTNTFNGLVLHEAGGHGFAKLADEYSYEYMGLITQEAINAAHNKETWGWWKNVDFTNDPTQVKWSPFLSDNRYANEGLGCYEGGFTYWTGVWRPTENSIMRYNTGGFNAPSRYAIWYRINKLAYGDDWNGPYEDFVAYDAVNRTSAATAQPGRNYVLKQLPPLAPPVVVGHSWRDAK